MLAAFLALFAGMLVVMTAAWITQKAVSNAGWIDVFWTFGSGAACVAAALWPAPGADFARQLLVAALGAIWSLRLGLYLFARVAGSHEDARYAALRTAWGRNYDRNLFLFANVQATGALISLSVYAAAHVQGAALGARDMLGAAILVVAVFGEGLADEQMQRFKARRERPSVMDEGLWAWSRHPNYFFEWLGWLAYPAIGFDPAHPPSWATWIAPVLMYLILRHGTGVPALEKSMLESRGETFRAYQQRVSVFFPLPPRRRSA